jgi:hypothetical protein
MLSDVIEGVFEFVFHMLIEIPLFYTGELVLFILTLGKKRPRWDYYLDESPGKWILLTEPSIWIGFVFWFFAIVFIAKVLF